MSASSATGSVFARSCFRGRARGKPPTAARREAVVRSLRCDGMGEGLASTSAVLSSCAEARVTSPSASVSASDGRVRERLTLIRTVCTAGLWRSSSLDHASSAHDGLECSSSDARPSGDAALIRKGRRKATALTQRNGVASTHRAVVFGSTAARQDFRAHTPRCARRSSLSVYELH